RAAERGSHADPTRRPRARGSASSSAREEVPRWSRLRALGSRASRPRQLEGIMRVARRRIAQGREDGGRVGARYAWPRGSPAMLQCRTMTTQTIRVGFVGAGNNTRRRHIPGFRALPGIELVDVANRTRV